MISQTLQDAINDQIQAELYSSYLYLSMSAYFDSQNLKGFGQWMRVQSQEEYGHAMKFLDYLDERGGRVTLKAIQQPPTEFGSPVQVFEQTLGHEKEVTGRIYRLHEQARSEKDPATESFLQWFVDEQVEEEATASEVLATLKMVGSSGSGLVMLDRQLGKRGE